MTNSDFTIVTNLKVSSNLQPPVPLGSWLLAKASPSQHRNLPTEMRSSCPPAAPFPVPTSEAAAYRGGKSISGTAVAALRKNFPEGCISGNDRSLLSALQVLEPTWSKDAACGPLEAPKPSPRWLHIWIPAVAQLKELLSSLERKACSALLPPIHSSLDRGWSVSSGG